MGRTRLEALMLPHMDVVYSWRERPMRIDASMATYRGA